MKFKRSISMILAIAMALTVVVNSSTIIALSSAAEAVGNAVGFSEHVDSRKNYNPMSSDETEPVTEPSDPAVTTVSEGSAEDVATPPSSDLPDDSLPTTEEPSETVTEIDEALPEVGEDFTEATEDIYFCGMPEHTHSEACFDSEGNLVCGVAEHVHTEFCLVPEQFGIMTMSIVHEESSADGYDFVLSLNGSGGYTLTFTGTKIPSGSELKQMLKIDGTDYSGLVNIIVVNDSVTEIGDNAFDNMQKLASVEFRGINPNIKSIPNYCFQSCPLLTSVNLENLSALKSIGNRAFSGTNIKTVTIPSTVDKFGQEAFLFADSIETVYFEENEVLTNPPSFKQMKGLKNINLENLKAETVYIQSEMFRDCTSLESLYIPSNFSPSQMSAISYANIDNLCSGCASLRELVFAPNPRIRGLTNVTGGTAVENLDLSPLYELGYYSDPNSPVKSIVFDSSLENSGGVYLNGCSHLETVEFKSDVLADKIAERAFGGCTSLRAIDLEKFVNIKTVESAAFSGCSSISNLTIPSTVTAINDRAFNGMSDLKSMTLNANLESSSVNLFDGVSGLVLTVGEEVTTLNRNFLIALNGHFKDIIFPANSTFTLPAGDSVGGIFGDGTDEQTYYTDADGNLYLLKDGSLSLVYANKSLEAVKIPASVGGYNVTAIASYAFENSAATSVTVENPSAIVLSDYAFTDAHNLASINDKSEAGEIKKLFANASAIPDVAFEGTKITNSSKVNPAENLSGASPAQSAEATYGNTTGIKATRQGEEKLLTGQSSVVGLEVSNYDSEFYRVYVMVDDPRWFSEPTIGEQNEYIQVDGPKKVPGENIRYFDFIPNGTGSTLSTNISINTKNYPTPSGTSAYIWTAALSKDKLNDTEVHYPQTGDNKEDNVFVSPDYIKITWETNHNKFSLSKTLNNDTDNYPLGFQKSATDDQVALKPISYHLGLTSDSGSSSGSGTEYGADYVKTVVFKDTFQIPEGLKWRDGIDVDKISKIITGNSASIYAEINGKEYLVAQASGFGGAAGSITDIKLEKSTDGKITVVWTVENSSLDGASPSEISVNAESALISFGGDIILRENKSELTEYEVQNHTDADITFTHGDTQKVEADSEETTVKVTPGEVSIEKTLVGTEPKRMNEPISYNLKIWNKEAYDATLPDIKDIFNGNDTSTRTIYLKPEEIERLFREEKYGEYLEISVTDAYFLNEGVTVPTETFIAVDGETVGTRSYLDSTVNTLDDYRIFDEPDEGKNRLQQFKGKKENVTYTYDANSDLIKFSYGGNEITVGEGGKYPTLAAAMEALKMYVGYTTQYHLDWKLAGKNITLPAGEELNIRINAYVKDSFMMLNGKTDGTMDTDHPFRAGYSGEWIYDRKGSWNPQLRQEFFKAINYAELVDAEHHDTVGPYVINNDLDVVKDAYVDGEMIESDSDVRPDMDIEYALSLKHWGTGTYDTLPVVDHVSGLQAVLAPVDLNSDAEWAQYADIHYVDGRAYYALSLKGTDSYTYKGVQFDEYFADRIVVSEQKGTDGRRTGLDTLLYFYFVDTLPFEYDREIRYPVTTDRGICLGDDAGTSNIATWGIYNAVWVNDVPGRRLTDVIGFNGSVLNFEKKISTERGAVPSLDTVADISPISEGQNEVWYRMHLYNFSMTDSVAITGDQIYDILPQTYGKFDWNTDNVKIVWIDDSSNPTITYDPSGENKPVKIENGEMTVEGVDESLWTISETEPGSKRYRIDFDGKLQFSFAPMQSLYFYVVVTFPTETQWDEYYKDVTDGDVDKSVENSLFVFNMEDRVEHYLVNPGKALLQKGVYEIGTYSVGDDGVLGDKQYKFYDYYIGHDRTHYSFNADDADEIEGQAQLNTVTYYIIIENTGDGRLYLTDVYDVLPEGFEFLSLRGSAGRKWGSETWYMDNYTSYSVGGVGTPNFNISASEGGLNYLVVWATDDAENVNKQDKDNSKFRNATITATTNDNTVTFSFSSPSTATHAKDMDYDDNGVYLNEGEYTQIVFTAVTGSKKDLGEALSAENTAFMEYYVPGITDANVEVDTETGISVSTRNNLSSNDGDRKLWGLEEAKASGVKDLKTINKEPKFLASSVDVLPGSIIPGVQKNLEGEASRPYKENDTVNWDLKLFNDGDRAMPFDFEETIQSPLRFKGKMTYELYAGSKGIYTDNTDLDGLLLTAIVAEKDSFDQSKIKEKVKDKDNNYLFDFTEWKTDSDGSSYALINTRDSSGSTNEYKLYVGKSGELGKLYKKVGGDWTEVSNNLVKLQLVTINRIVDRDQSDDLVESHSTFTYYVPIYLTKNADGDLTFRVEFSKASLEEGSLSKTVANALAIPAGGHVEMTVGSEMPSGVDGVGMFMNTASVIPVDSFDPSYVTHGIDFKEDSKAGVESSAMINYYQGFQTESHKEIVEVKDPTNDGTSEDPTHNKIFLDSSEKLFTYRLIFDNKNIDQNKKLKKLVFVDPLPDTNDKYTLSGSKNRSSEFTVNFADDPNVKVYSVDIDASGTETKTEIPSSNYTVEYSTTTEKSDLDGDGLNGTNNSSAWHVGLQTDDRSMRVIINDNDGTYLNVKSGSKCRRIIVEFNAKVSGDAKPGEVSWNNFAYRYTYEDKTAGDSNDKVLTAQTPVVGIQFPSERVIKKAVVDANGKPYAFDADKTYRFVIYYKNDQAEDDKSVDITDFSEKGIANALKELSDAKKIVATLVELKVNKGKSEGSISLDGLKTYTPSNDTFTVSIPENAFSWIDGETYHVIEIADDSVIESVTFNGTPNQFDFTYNRSVGFVIKAENRLKTWDAKIVKTDKDSGKLLSGATFGIYTSKEIDGADTAMNGGEKLYLYKTVTTNADGTAEISGLTEDEYYIKEITAPEGYKIDNDSYVKITRGADGVVVTAKFADTKKAEPSKLGNLEILKTMNDAEPTDSFKFVITLTFPSKGVDTIEEGSKVYIANQHAEDDGGGKKEKLTVNWKIDSASSAGYFFSAPKILKIRDPITLSEMSGKIENIEPGDVQDVTVTLKVGQKLTFDNLPDGTVYTVSEELTSDQEKTITPKDKTLRGAISVGSSDTVQVKYENIKYSAVSFTKTISPVDGNTEREFSFMLTFKDESGKTISDTSYPYAVKSGGSEISKGTVKSGGVIDGIKHGDTVTVDKLPIGTKVYIGEFKSSDDYIDINVDGKALETYPSAKGTYYGRTVTVDEDTASVTFTNTVPEGKLRITKTVKNPDDFADAIFKFKVKLGNSSGTPVSGEFKTNTHSSDGDADGTVIFDKNGIGYVNAAPNQYVEISGLPTGATYTVTEESGSVGGKQIDPSTYGSVVTNGTGTIPANGYKTAEVSVLNFKSTELKLTKKTVGSLKGPFEVSVDVVIPSEISGDIIVTATVYNAGGVQKNSEKFTVKGQKFTHSESLDSGDYLVISGLPENSNVTFSETSSGNYVGVLVSPDGIREYINGSNEKGLGEYELVNVPTGKLTLSKTVDGITADGAGDFEFEITFTPDGDYAEAFTAIAEKAVVEPVDAKVSAVGNTLNVKVKAGGSVTVSNLPDGVNYSVSETAESQKGYNVSFGAPGTHEGTISAESESKVSVVNTLKKDGVLTVKKEISGDGADSTDLFKFTVTFTPLDGVTLDSSYTADRSVKWSTEGKNLYAKFSLKGGESVKFSGLPYGTEYKVVEDDANNFGYGTSIPNAEGTVGNPDTTVTVTATNTRGVGKLKITKKLDKIYGDEPADGFEISLTLTDADGNPMVGTYDYTSNISDRGGKTTLDSAGKCSLKLLANETVTIENLPNGAKYEIVEIGADNYTVSYDENQTGYISQGSVAEVTVTNTRKTQNLEISKSVDVEDAEYANPADEFVFNVTLTLGGDPLTGLKYNIKNSSTGEPVSSNVTFDGTVTLHAGETAVFENLPVGTVYTVTEEPIDNYVEESSVNTSGTITEGSDSTASFVNSALKHDYTVEKVIDGFNEDGEVKYVNPGDSVTYKITVTGTGAEGSVNKDISFSDTLPNWLIVDSDGIRINKSDSSINVEPTFEVSTDESTTYTWTIDRLGYDQTVTVYITAKVDEYITKSMEWKNVVSSPNKTDDPSDEIESDPGKLKLSKYVTDLLGNPRSDDDTLFEFEIKLTLPQNSTETLRDSYPYIYTAGKVGGGSINGKVENQSDGSQVGTYTVSLRHGQTVEIQNLPVGAAYVITEIPTGSKYKQGEIANSSGNVELNAASAEFTNIYVPTPAESEIGFTKNFTGDLPDGTYKFSFKAELTDATKAAAVEYDKTAEVSFTTKLGETSVTEDGKFGFSFKAAGTYKFKISEDTSANLKAVHYGGEEYTVTFNVTDDGKGGLKVAAPTVEGSVSEAVFNNTFDPTFASYQLSAKKTLKGNVNSDTAYSFTVTVTKTKEAGVPISNQETIEKKINLKNSDSVVVIDEKYTKAGEYVYEIAEKSENEKGITYDDTTYTVTVNVFADYDGTLHETVKIVNNKTSNEVNSVEFVNSYEPNSVTAKVSAAKTISGRSWADGDSGEYTFILEPATPSLNDANGKKGILPSGKEKLTAKAVTNSAKDGGIATFEDITFTEVGNYYYTLSEEDVPDEIHGVDKDPKKVSVIIRVNDNGGDLKASVSYDGDDSVEFTNVFTSGKASIGGLKSISGRAWTSADSGIYEFTLKPIGSAPMPSGSKEENGEVSYTVKATTAAGGNGGRFVFPAISYENEGTYEYTITETGGSADGVSRDENVAKVKVVIDENLHPTVTYSYAGGEYSSERPTFSNIYTPEAVKTNLKAQKDIDGRDWDDDIDVDRYEFTLTPESSGSPMPEGSENGGYTAKASKGGKIEFPEISFDKIGSYVYIIAEKKYDANGVKSTSETHKATVNVADADNNGVLEITVKYDSDSDDAPTFVNEYSHGTAEAVVSVKKKLLKNGTEQPLNGYSFSFALSEGENPNSGMVLPESKTASVSDETAKAEFEKITFTKAGKYSVTVKENDNGGEVIYDQRTLTVWFDVVEDPEKGELSVTIVYEFDDKTDDPTFENELEPSAPHVTIEKTQQVNGDGEPTKEKLEVKANDDVTYFLTVTSDGEDGSIAKNVTVTDKVPDGLILISISGGGTESGGVITWQLGDMPKGDKKTVSFTVRVPDEGNSWLNVAKVSYTTPDEPNTPEEEPSNEVEIFENPKLPNIVIEKDQSRNGAARTKAKLEVEAGDEVTYYITVTSNGETTAKDVVITDKIPNGLSLVDGTISDGGSLGEDGVTITWIIGDLDFGKSKTVNFTVTVPAVTEHTEWVNSASTHYSNNPNNPDNPDNPDEPETDIPSNEVKIEELAPHISIEKEQSAGDGGRTKEKLEVQPLDEVTYFLTVISDGEDGSIAKNVTVIDKVPDGLTLIGISDGGTENSGVITWQLGDIPKGYKKTVSFTVTVPEVVGGAEWTNIAYTYYDRPNRPEEPEIPSNEVEIEEKFGSLIIRKTVGGNAGDTVGAFEFLIVLTDGSGNPLSGRYPYSGSRSGEIISGEKISLSHGESVTIEGIPVGTHYEVTEIDSRGHTAKSSGNVGEISSEAASVANFVNIRNIEQPNIPDGSLTISKTVEDDGDASREFIFTLRLYDAFGRELTGSFGYVGSKSGRISSGGTVTLKHGESITVLGIPAGTQYVVTEEPAEEYISIPTGETGTITPGGEEIAAFINVPVIIVQRPTEAGHLGEDTIESIAPDEVSKRSQRGNLAIILLALATAAVWTVALMSMRKKRHRK